MRPEIVLLTTHVHAHTYTYAYTHKLLYISMANNPCFHSCESIWKKQSNIYVNWIQRFNLFNWPLWLAVKSTEEKEVEIIGTINCDQLNIAVVGRPGEMAQPWRARTSPAENPCSVPRTHVGHLTTASNSSSGQRWGVGRVVWIPLLVFEATYTHSIYPHRDTKLKIKRIFKKLDIWNIFKRKKIKCSKSKTNQNKTL